MNRMVMNRRCCSHSEQGITLVELIMVMMIVAVLSAIAIPPVLQWIQNADNRASARQVMTVLRETRAKAIASNMEHRVIFEDANRRYRVVRGDRQIDSTEWTTVIYEWLSLPSNVHVDANVHYIHINTNGTANGGTISILDDVGTKLYNITISRTGRIRIWS